MQYRINIMGIVAFQEYGTQGENPWLTGKTRKLSIDEPLSIVSTCKIRKGKRYLLQAKDYYKAWVDAEYITPIT